MLESAARMTKLSVNVNKLATLRNSRGKNIPDVVQLSRDILNWGAHGLTVHPRPDGRHIRFEDVRALSAVVREFNQTHKTSVEFNIEGYPSSDYLALVDETRPDQATLVPDPPEALTSNAGWRVAESQKLLTQVCTQLRQQKVRSSIFVDPATLNQADYMALSSIQVDRVEFYTEAFADAFATDKQSSVLNQYQDAAKKITAMNIGINAGHDLNQKNLGALVVAIPQISEVSIGHALISEALCEGLPTTINHYLRILGWR